MCMTSCCWTQLAARNPFRGTCGLDCAGSEILVSWKP
jgi:hypothetical protein